LHTFKDSFACQVSTAPAAGWPAFAKCGNRLRVNLEPAMHLRVALIACALLAATPALAQIRVRAAVYGENCQSSSDVTAAVAERCNGRIECRYRVDHTVIGDPAPGCVKDFRVKWSCGGQRERQRSVGGEHGGEASGQSIHLDCAD
jgi:hypothetical protein